MSARPIASRSQLHSNPQRTLDILGVGVGWLQKEFQFLNADFARRSAMADEAITTMRVLWRDERASFQGQFL